MDERLVKEYERELGSHIICLLDSLSALHAVSEIPSRSTDETTLLRNALKALMQNQEMERCSFFILRGEQFVNVSWVCLDDLNAEEVSAKETESAHGVTQSFGIGEGVIGMAALTRSIQHCRDCRTDPNFRIKEGQVSDFMPGSVISAPVENGEELLGVLNISHPQANFFSDAHIRLLRIFCNVLGQLIMNCRLHLRLEEQIAERTRQLAEALEEARILKDRFEALSFTDELTSLFNRRYFFSQAEKMLSAAFRYDQPLSVLALDLDHFKQINDNCGHAFGDRVLIDVAGILKRTIRESDLLARLGGEEFILLAPNTDQEEGMALAERIRVGVQEMVWEDHGSSFRISISIGLSCLKPQRDKQAVHIDELVREADLALYEAKRSGRNRVAAYSMQLSD